MHRERKESTALCTSISTSSAYSPTASNNSCCSSSRTRNVIPSTDNEILTTATVASGMKRGCTNKGLTRIIPDVKLERLHGGKSHEGDSCRGETCRPVGRRARIVPGTMSPLQLERVPSNDNRINSHRRGVSGSSNSKVEVRTGISASTLDQKKMVAIFLPSAAKTGEGSSSRGRSGVVTSDTAAEEGYRQQPEEGESVAGSHRPCGSGESLGFGLPSGAWHATPSHCPPPLQLGTESAKKRRNLDWGNPAGKYFQVTSLEDGSVGGGCSRVKLFIPKYGTKK